MSLDPYDALFSDDPAALQQLMDEAMKDLGSQRYSKFTQGLDDILAQMTPIQRCVYDVTSDVIDLMLAVKGETGAGGSLEVGLAIVIKSIEAMRVSIAQKLLEMSDDAILAEGSPWLKSFHKILTRLDNLERLRA